MIVNLVCPYCTKTVLAPLQRGPTFGVGSYSSKYILRYGRDIAILTKKKPSAKIRMQDIELQSIYCEP